MYVCTYVCMHVYLCVCIYIYIYIYGIYNYPRTSLRECGVHVFSFCRCFRGQDFQLLASKGFSYDVSADVTLRISKVSHSAFA